MILFCLSFFIFNFCWLQPRYYFHDPLPCISNSLCLKNTGVVDVWFFHFWNSSVFLEHPFSSFGSFSFPMPAIISMSGCWLSALVTQTKPMKTLTQSVLNWAGREVLCSSMKMGFKNIIPKRPVAICASPRGPLGESLSQHLVRGWEKGFSWHLSSESSHARS